MPFGTIAAFGYKYNVTEKLAIFAELEYMNIAVKRDYSELREFNQTLKATISVAGQNRNVEVPLKSLDGFTNGSYNDVLRGQVYHQHTDYVEEATKEELANNSAKKLTEKASYSSLGVNFWCKKFLSNHKGANGIRPFLSSCSYFLRHFRSIAW